MAKSSSGPAPPMTTRRTRSGASVRERRRRPGCPSSSRRRRRVDAGRVEHGDEVARRARSGAYDVGVDRLVAVAVAAQVERDHRRGRASCSARTQPVPSHVTAAFEAKPCTRSTGRQRDAVAPRRYGSPWTR